MPARKYPRGSTFTGSAEQDMQIADAIQGGINRLFGAGNVQAAADAAQAAMQPVVDAVKSPALNDRVLQIAGNAKRALADPLSTIMRVVNKAVPAAIASCASLQYTGGIGSFENFLSPLYLRMKFFQVDGDRAAFVGRPCCKTARLSTLTGFALCENVKLDLPGTSTEPPATLEEQQIVIRYLEAGVYIE